MMDEKVKIRIASKIAFIAGAFISIVSILLLLNYIQLKTVDPLENKSIQVLVNQLASQPENQELKEEIRNLDLMARKAFFTSQWQINTGAHLLVFSSILLIISLRFYYSYVSKIEKPKDAPSDILSRTLSQRWILVAGASVVVLALVAAYFTRNELKYYSDMLSPDNQSEMVADSVEVIEITERSDSAITENDLITGDSGIDTIQGDLMNENKRNTDFPGITEIRNNHNSFRGPFGNGISYRKNIPANWDGSSGKNIKWKTAVLKSGHNSPVIWGDKLFIAGADAKSKMIFCYDRITGKLIWQKEAGEIQGSPATPPKTTDDTGLSAPTLTTDGKNVFAIFGTGDVIAFDIEGNKLWARNLGVPNNHYGHASSLISWKEKLFIQFDSNRGGRLIALNVSTGEILWDKTRTSRISWASPILAEIAGKFQIILASTPSVAGYDVENGNEIWSVDCLSGEIGPSPAYAEGLVYAANEYARLAAINPLTKEIVWESNEYLPEVASPVVSKGLLFIATSYGVLVCYDAKTGEKYWEMEAGTGFYSSPIIADNKLFAFDLDGKAHIMEVSKELKIISEPDLGEKVVTTPAFADGTIYIRGEKNLFCIGN